MELWLSASFTVSWHYDLTVLRLANVRWFALQLVQLNGCWCYLDLVLMKSSLWCTLVVCDIWHLAFAQWTRCNKKTVTIDDNAFCCILVCIFWSSVRTCGKCRFFWYLRDKKFITHFMAKIIIQNYTKLNDKNAIAHNKIKTKSKTKTTITIT